MHRRSGPRHRVQADETSQASRSTASTAAFPRQRRPWIGGAGTAARFLTAAVAIGHGTFVVDGSRRCASGRSSRCSTACGRSGSTRRAARAPAARPWSCAPGHRGGRARVRGDISSQYFSALLLAAPYAARDVEIEVDGDLVSAPYVEMTLSTMEAFGVRAERDGDALPGPGGPALPGPPLRRGAGRFRRVVLLRGGGGHRWPRGRAAARLALGAGRSRAARCARAHGLRGAPIEHRRIAVPAPRGCARSTRTSPAWATSPPPYGHRAVRRRAGTVAGIAQTHYEESDRPVAAATELRRMGLRVESSGTVTIHPGTPQPREVETYDDHRMAMSFAVTGLRAPGSASSIPVRVQDVPRVLPGVG